METMSTTFSNKFMPLASYDLIDCVESPTRFDPSKRSHRESKVLYRNYTDLIADLDSLRNGERHGTITRMIKRLNDPMQRAKETNTWLLIYRLRLQALIWAYFGGNTYQD